MSDNKIETLINGAKQIKNETITEQLLSPDLKSVIEDSRKNTVILESILKILLTSTSEEQKQAIKSAVEKA